MNDMKQPLVQMFDLLSREEGILLDQIAEERDAIERLNMVNDLKNVKIILSEITSTLFTTVEAAHLHMGANLHAHANHVSLSLPSQ